MEQWFIEEWRTEREANRIFREDVVQRLTKLETAKEEDEKTLEADANRESRIATWVGVLVAVGALIVSVIALG